MPDSTTPLFSLPGRVRLVRSAERCCFLQLASTRKMYTVAKISGLQEGAFARLGLSTRRSEAIEHGISRKTVLLPIPPIHGERDRPRGNRPGGELHPRRTSSARPGGFLSRVHDEHLDKEAWAASPTVLDDVPRASPNACFFPAPTAAAPEGYGYTVDLNEDTPVYRREFLHGHIQLAVEDIKGIGEVTTDVSTSRIAQARTAHRELLASDFAHVGDLP